MLVHASQAALPEATPEELSELVAELAPWPVFKTAYTELTFAMRAANLTAGAVRRGRVPPEAVMATVRSCGALIRPGLCMPFLRPVTALRTFNYGFANLSCSLLPVCAARTST